jgi:hypothetical protein
MVDPIYQLESVSEPYNNSEYQAVENTLTRTRNFVERIPEIGIIILRNIPRNESRKISLAEIGINNPVMFRSIYVFSPQTTNDEILFNIYTRLDDGSDFRVAQQRYQNGDMPLQFPYGIVLSPNNVLEVEPRQDVENIRIYCSPVRVLFETII